MEGFSSPDEIKNERGGTSPVDVFWFSRHLAYVSITPPVEDMGWALLGVGITAVAELVSILQEGSVGRLIKAQQL